MATGHVQLLLGEMVGEGDGEGAAEHGFDATIKIRRITKLDSIIFMSLVKLEIFFFINLTFCGITHLYVAVRNNMKQTRPSWCLKPKGVMTNSQAQREKRNAGSIFEINKPKDKMWEGFILALSSGEAKGGMVLLWKRKGVKKISNNVRWDVIIDSYDKF